MKISLDFSHPGIRRIFLLWGRRFSAWRLSDQQLIITILASWLESGSIPISITRPAYRDPSRVFIVSIGNVILPEMSRMSAVEDMKS